MIKVNIRRQGGAAIMTIPSNVLKRLNVEVGASLELDVNDGAFTGRDTTGAAVCNQARSFDIEARERYGSARYVETLDAVTTDEIVSRVLSVIDPAP